MVSSFARTREIHKRGILLVSIAILVIAVCPAGQFLVVVEGFQPPRLPLRRPDFNTAELPKETMRRNGKLFNITTRVRSFPRNLLGRSQNRSKTKQQSPPPPPIVVRDVHELRQRVLQEQIPLQDLVCNFTQQPLVNATSATPSQLETHAVLRLMADRARTNSTPGNRAADDTAHLSLAIEGGGMRGAVSAGMAAAIASLGLSNVFDSIYGSSAGSIVGAYMISRQMCVDVYTDVLPAAGPRFASRGRVLGNVGVGVATDFVARLRARGSAVDGAEDDLELSTISQGSINNETESSPGRVASLISRVVSKVPLVRRTPKLLSSLRPYFTLQPGMNLTFVLNGIMDSNYGLRPFDLDSFRMNDLKQPLYVVSSTVRGGQLETVAFNSKEGDFWDIFVEGYEEDVIPQELGKHWPTRVVKRALRRLANLFAALVRKSKNGARRVFRRRVETGKITMTSENEDGAQTGNARQLVLQKATSCPNDSGKKGFFASLESSMLVPGAAGPPVKLLRSKNRKNAKEFGVSNSTNICFDAFCYEPIPYRSAVENGATHVLALRSRPDGCIVEVKPATYEKIVAAVYFRLNRLPIVGEFFEKGGSQYRYIEDVLTLDEGLAEGIRLASSPRYTGVKVPPTEILFGTRNDGQFESNPNSWKTAHLFPIVLPANTPELPALTQEKDEVLMAVRNGYAAAFDMLAPIAGLDFDPESVDSKLIAAMVFPRTDDEDMYVLENPVQVKGEFIEKLEIIERETKAKRRFVSWIARKRRQRKIAKRRASRNPFKAAVVKVEKESPGMVGGKEDSLDWLEAEALLAALPGFRNGKLTHLAGGLRSQDN